MIMSDEIKAKIEQYIKSRYHINLATVTAEGTPQAHTLSYASDGAIVYIMTDPESRKAKNIEANAAVAYTVDDDDLDYSKLTAVQMEGRAQLVMDAAEVAKAHGLMEEKFPGIKELGKMDPPPNLVVFRITPTIGYYLDNTISWGHRDQVKY
jgi:nitroimidazol reductase NimA-like FMN-containing flavoprotein (pyridoxamine 5'-phosphate oxidase superfamily)